MSLPESPNGDSAVPHRLGLYLGIGPANGGVFQYAQAVAEALSTLDARQFTVIVAYSDENWKPILARFSLRGHLLRHATLGQKIADGAAAMRLPGSICRSILQFANPLVRELLALLCTTWIFPAQESLTYQMPTRSVGTIHDLMHRYEYAFPEVGNVIKKSIREHKLRNLVQYSSAVLVDSKVGAQHVVESYGASPQKIFPLPYVAPSYLKQTSERSDFDSFYRLPKQFLFYPAQLWPHKNHFKLIEAVALARRNFPDIAVVLSGAQRNNFEPQLRRFVASLSLNDRIIFVGHVPDSDLGGFYRRARALVMPTFFGPTNIPPLEAMAMGCPAVVSDIYGMREQSGDAALYFDPRSAEQIAQCIQRIWSDDKLVSQLVERGYARHNLYGQAEFSARLEQILRITCDIAGRPLVQITARNPCS